MDSKRVTVCLKTETPFLGCPLLITTLMRSETKQKGDNEKRRSKASRLVKQ